MSRTILVHLNCEVPENFTGTATDLATDIYGAICVGTDEDHTPNLYNASVVVALAEEV